MVTEPVNNFGLGFWQKRPSLGELSPEARSQPAASAQHESCCMMVWAQRASPWTEGRAACWQ